MVATVTSAVGVAGGIDLAFTTPHGTAVATVEMNTEADFASADTFLFTMTPANGANTAQIRGLPNATPFWLRVRISGIAGYSNVVLVATARVAPAGYDGFSIDKAMVVVPAPLQITGEAYGGGSSRRPGFLPDNLLRPDPLSTWQFTTATAIDGSSSIQFTTSGEPIDTIALLGTNAGDDCTFDLAHMSVPGGALNGRYGGPLRCSPTIGRRPSYHMLLQLPAPVTDRYWYITVGMKARHFLARNLVVGLARQSINANVGAGVNMGDTGTAARGRFGVMDVVSGWRGRQLDMELGWLHETEYHTKWADLEGLVGRTKPVLILPNSKRNVWMNDRIGFGPIVDTRAETLRGKRHSRNISVDSSY